MLLESLDRLLEVIKEKALDLYGERLITLAVYGSVGRGVPRPDSDVDLLIVASRLPEGRLRRMEEFSHLEDSLSDVFDNMRKCGITPVLSPVIKTPHEVKSGSLLFLDMIEDARILYDRNGFFAGYLDELKTKLQALGAKKVKWKGAWYWDLKPDFRRGETIDL
ncbi:MAG TPA: nucleotidyltransferase domain-containing protein [Firmicutes bacterium]|nr:nucleotidyltransferase domain-containing protein [Bacillota bacterium]HHY98363.1 nucleotidyltransferase domain-containing protein [Bacillota bacterium]